MLSQQFKVDDVSFFSLLCKFSRVHVLNLLFGNFLKQTVQQPRPLLDTGREIDSRVSLSNDYASILQSQ